MALEMLADLGYTTDGRTTREMIISFQKDHSVIQSEKDDGAGLYGPRTRAALLVSHDQYSTLRARELEKIEAGKALLLSEKNEWEKTYELAKEKVSSLGSPKKREQ